MDQNASPSPDALAACERACVATQAVLHRFANARPAGREEDALGRLLRDCAEVCAATAGFVRADSVFRARMLEACADICEQCATAHKADAAYAEVVAACRECAAYCRAAIGSGGAAA